MVAMVEEDMVVEAVTSLEEDLVGLEDSEVDIKATLVDMETRVVVSEVLLATAPEMAAEVVHLKETMTTQSLSAISEMLISAMLRTSSEVST